LEKSKNCLLGMGVTSITVVLPFLDDFGHK
jgi:hypothetical protein